MGISRPRQEGRTGVMEEVAQQSDSEDALARSTTFGFTYAPGMRRKTMATEELGPKFIGGGWK